MFWDISEPLSYNALFNFILGNRNAGKTYGSKQWCIDDFLKNKNQFAWVRRFDSELDDFKDTFFTDICNEYPEVEFEYKGYKFYINKEVAGFSFPLTTSMKKKSSSYPKVTKLIFDEFIIDVGTSYYLKNEVQIFLNLYETIFRMRDNVKGAFFLANSISFINPYTLYFDLRKPINKKGIWRNGELLVQFVNDAELINAKLNTRFGKLTKGTAFGNFAVNNEFLRDNDDFILEKQPDKLMYFFTMKANSENYGVWISHQEGCIYVSAKYDPSFKLIYTTMLDNHKPNTMLLKGASRSVLFSTFVKAFKMGNVYFDSIKTKNIVLETIKNTL